VEGMNIFKIHQAYRELGINYGLPTYFVDFGIGVNYQPAEVAQRLLTLGLKKGGWVTFRNNPVGERGCGVLVSGLKQLGYKIEVEDSGIYGTPGWFPSVDRWIIWWSKTSKFNYGALRPRQDMLIYRGDDIVGFLGDTEDCQALRAVIVKDRKEIWELVRDKEIRVYEE